MDRMLCPEAGAKLVQQPECGIAVDPATATEQVGYTGTTYYFCSAGCRKTFDKDPGKYIARQRLAPPASARRGRQLEQF
jgi:P-type Cu+ transporter